MAEELKKFQTINLADFYNQNGSQYSTMGDITPYSAGGTRFDNTSPIAQNITNQTPLDAFVEAIQNPEKLAEVQEKSGIEVFPLPATPEKMGITPSGFTFAPAFTTQDVATFNFVPQFDTATVTNNIITPDKQGITVTNNIVTPQKQGITVTNNMANPPGTAPSVANNMGNPPGTAPSVTNNMTDPDHGFASLIVGDFIKNVHAIGFIDRKGLVNKGTDFIGILGDGNPLTYLHQGGGIYQTPNLKGGNFYPDYDARGFVTGKHHLDPSDFIGVAGDEGNMTFTFQSRGGGGQIWGWNRSIYNDKFPQGVPVDGFGNQKANGFILGKNHLGLSDFKGVSKDKAYSYPTDISPFQSYAFTDLKYPLIMNNVKTPSAPGAKDGVGQAFNVIHSGNVTGKKYRFAEGIELLGQFKTKIEDLYSDSGKKLRDASFNSGFYGEQPFVTTDIGSNWSIFADGPGPVNGDSAIRGSVGTAAGRVLKDAERIGGYLLSPSGLIFLAKNVGMQLSNPRVQSATLAGLIRTRIYPLGISTLAQTLVNPLGIHLTRHGYGPLETTGTHYEENASELDRIGKADQITDSYGLRKLRPFKGASRMYALGKELKVGYFGDGEKQTLIDKAGAAIKTFKKFIAKIFTGREKIDKLSGLLGPHSVYGIGRTRIFRSKVGVGIGDHENAPAPDVAGLTQGFMRNQADGQKLEDHPSKPLVTELGHIKGETKRYTDKVKGGKSAEITNSEIGNFAEKTMNEKAKLPPSLQQNAENNEIRQGLSHTYETIAYGKIKEAQGELTTPSSINDFRKQIDPANSITPAGNQFFEEGKDMSRVARFRENYGRRDKQVADRYKLPGGFDIVGLSDSSVTPDTNGNPAPANALNLPEEVGGEETKFEDLILFQFKTLQPIRNTVQLRAMLTDMTDTLSPNYEEIQYVGRTSPLYLFRTIARETKFSFKMYAMTRQELDAQYIRLNRLMQIISPGFTAQNLPIGPIVSLTIGNYFKDIPVVVDSFDISIPDSSPWDIDEGRQLPLYLEVSMGCKVMFNENNTFDATTGQPLGGEQKNEIINTKSNFFNAINSNFKKEAAAPSAES